MHLARGILQPGLASIIDSRILVSKELHLDQVVAAATSFRLRIFHTSEGIRNSFTDTHNGNALSLAETI